MVTITTSLERLQRKGRIDHALLCVCTYPENLVKICLAHSEIIVSKRSVKEEDERKYKNSSGDEIAYVNFLRRYGTYVLQNTKKENLLRLTN